MITLFQIDKSGSDIFEKDYSIALIKDNKETYGVNIPQSVKDNLINLLNTKQLGITGNFKSQKLRLKIRFHTAIIILLIEKAIKDEGYLEEVSIQICNDLDGHFHEVKDMIFKRFYKLIPSLRPDNIVLTKFAKTSLVDIAAKNLREKNNQITKEYNLLKIDLKEIINIIKK